MTDYHRMFRRALVGLAVGGLALVLLVVIAAIRLSSAPFTWCARSDAGPVHWRADIRHIPGTDYLLVTGDVVAIVRTTNAATGTLTLPLIAQARLTMSDSGDANGPYAVVDPANGKVFTTQMTRASAWDAAERRFVDLVRDTAALGVKGRIVAPPRLARGGLAP